jgi:hypothetical protein
MALTQYNQFEPRLDPVNGLMQQEPRVFAHDAVAIAIGAVNDSHSNHGLKVTNKGSGYAVDDTITLSSPAAGGAPNRAVVTVSAVDGSGAVTDYSVTTVGSLYVQDEAFTQAATSGGGSNFAGNVINIDIPNTFKRGCCIYVGNSGDVEVIMESGNTAVFAGVPTGSFLPILVKQVVTTNTTATNLLALY